MSQDTMDAERDGRLLERKRIVRYIEREARQLKKIGKDAQSEKVAQCFLFLARRIQRLPEGKL
jgi:hypothetical protein